MSYCNWKNTSVINRKYHDNEWGIPVFNDYIHFEYLTLEIMQCGLNWNMIINKRQIFKNCFNNFDFDIISKYTENDITNMMQICGMIKSYKKIAAVINNAKCFQNIKEEFETFSNYIWNFSDYKTILYDNHELGFIPSCNGLSDEISKDLKKRGFMFLGSVTVYSYLQAVGIINDHDKNCIRYNFINSNYPTIKMNGYLERGVHYFGN